jgi:hypothetical protein
MAEKDSRRPSYPVQTPEFTPHPEMSAENAEQKPRHFPNAIRALRDSSAKDPPPKDSSSKDCGESKPQHPRTIVICLDGTGDQYDDDNSNVVNFVSCLKKHWHAEQVTYYQSGIGTYDKGGLKNGIGAAMDMAVGSGLGKRGELLGIMG